MPKAIVDKFSYYEEQDCGFRSPCWVWKGGTDGDGYGRVRNGRKIKGAHRLFYERYRGPIPAGLVVDHLCRNTSCVNPDHLEAVTQAANIQRKSNARLNPEAVEIIRSTPRVYGSGVALAGHESEERVFSPLALPDQFDPFSSASEAGLVEVETPKRSPSTPNTSSRSASPSKSSKGDRGISCSLPPSHSSGHDSDQGGAA